MKQKALLGSRYIFGLAFFVFGLNGFLGFLEQPPMNEAAGSMIGALVATGYFMPMIKGFEVLVGLALLTNKFVPLALAVIAPILVGISTIHLFLDPAGMPMVIGLHLLHGFLVYGYWSYFKSVVTPKAELN